MDPPLDAAGEAEAAALGRALASRRPAAVVTSPRLRARQTAIQVASRAGLTFTTDSRLDDRDYGSWSGAVAADIVAEWGSLDRAPGVEPLDNVRQRVWEAMEWWVSVVDGTVVVVAHDAVNRMVLSVVQACGDEIGQRTGCWNELSHDEQGWHVLAVDQVP